MTVRPTGKQEAAKAKEVLVKTDGQPLPEATEPVRSGQAPVDAPVSAASSEAWEDEGQGDTGEGQTGHVSSNEEGAEPTHAPATQSRGASAPSSESGIASLLRDKRIGIIGAGAMGGALCRGLIHANAAPANRILVSDPHIAHIQDLHQTLGVKVAESNLQVAKYTDVILLAVKPYMVAGVLDEISEGLKREGGKPPPLLISIAAGVHIAKLEAHLKEPLPVVRAMPNTPAQVGLGACAYCRGTHANDTHMAMAAEIFRAVGIAVEVHESLMDAVTAVSGSGPAYVYLMIEAMVDGGVKVGLPRDIALKLASQTVLGAAQMVIETGMHPAQLRDMVTTPAGTTIAAIAGLEHSGLRAALIDAVERAAARSRELG